MLPRRKPMPPRKAPLRPGGPLSREATLERKTALRRGKPLNRHARINARNAERRAAEFERAFGGADRAAWVKRQPCLVCGRRPSENAHTHSAGMGYRADARHVVALCARHHRTGADSFHALGSARAFDAHHGTDLHAAAARLDAMWREHTT